MITYSLTTKNSFRNNIKLWKELLVNFSQLKFGNSSSERLAEETNSIFSLSITSRHLDLELLLLVLMKCTIMNM